MKLPWSTAYHSFTRRDDSGPYKSCASMIIAIIHLLYIVMSNQYAVAGVRWNNNISVATITVISYDYLLLLEKEVKYVWNRPWSPMACLYIIVRYLGLFLALLWGFWGGLLFMPEPVSYNLVVFLEWGYSAYSCFAEVILIWRLYALYNRSKLLLRVLLGLFLPIVAVSIATDVFLYSRSNVFSVQEIITADARYCTFLFKWGPLPVTYMSIPIVCFDILLLTLAAAKLIKHSRERRRIKVRTNTSISIIVRLHILYFVLNLINQIFLVILWADISV
ncbi:hypothetical protein BDR04DRAFT_1230533 [Suillus decipiens]|nr:hypothetical protein BDR04DRAFT_1230533 [Suillus decipiens]